MSLECIDTKETRQAILDILNYSDETKKLLQSTKVIWFYGQPIEIDEKTKEGFSTIEGIEKQISNFKGPVEIAYVLAYVEDKFVLQRWSIVVEKEYKRRVLWPKWPQVKPEDYLRK